MGDAFLAMLTGAIQLLLGVMGIYVSLRPPDKRQHQYWIYAFVIVGGLGVWLTYMLAQHADVAQRQAMQEIHEAQWAATDANAAATKANQAATAAQNETEAARQEARQAQQSLSELINKRSKETTKALIQLNTTTESSVKGISLPRRIPADMKTKLIADLSLHKGVVTINAIGGDSESMQFASDWYDVLSRSGWTITSAVNVVISPDPPIGARIKVRGEPVAASEQFTISGDHPAAALGRALFAVTPDVIGQREPALPEKATVLDIGILRRAGN
jgi:hypothetical protein